MNRHHANHRSGVTLIELLIYIAMAAILLGAIATLESTILQARQHMQAQVAVEEQGMIAMNTITGLVRNSAATVTPANATPSATLSLTMPAPAALPSIVDVSANVLRLSENGAAAQNLTAGKVSTVSLTVKNLTQPSAPSVLQVSFTLQAAWGHGQLYTQTFTSSTVRRTP
mgnify:CR=1 FL=1